MNFGERDLARRLAPAGLGFSNCNPINLAHGSSTYHKRATACSPEHGHPAEERAALAVLRRGNAHASAIAELIHFIGDIDAIKAHL